MTTEQRTRLTGLHSAIINDVTAEMGVVDNLIPRERIRALRSRELAVGTAHTAQFVETGYEETRLDDPRDECSRQYLDAIEARDFAVEAAPETKAGLWGELLSTIAQENDATGALVDGATRDSRLIE